MQKALIKDTTAPKVGAKEASRYLTSVIYAAMAVLLCARSGRAIAPEDLPTDEFPVNEVSVNKISVDESSVDESSIDESSVDTDIPEEILRTEIIVEARSPLTGELLTAAEYAQLQAELDREGRPPQLSSDVRQIVYLLRLRRILKPIFPFIKADSALSVEKSSAVSLSSSGIHSLIKENSPK